MRYERELPFRLAVLALLFVLINSAPSADDVDTSRGDEMLAAYFQNETQELADDCLTDVKSWDDWKNLRETYRQQLREMLGLDPLPERTPLEPVVTGKLDHPDFTVENLHFQSRPHLYVTGNLYLPKNVKGKAPGILYVCGHSKSIKDGVSFGNKAKYQHHGAWFAQNGYVCLVIDTLQLGEIEGLHHGTFRENMWWWNARGYTPAGVEAWNSIRALDYLESRPEVDASRLGVTGRSGGGAYSWYLTALDDRIKVTVPVAGITELKDHVVNGCVEGHCDCMFMVNTYRWDYPQLAALTAPRPLLISNTDRDRLFPLDGVLDVYRKVKRLYALNGKPGRIGLQLAAGPHEDLQVLQLYALQWFNEHLKGEDPLIESAAKSYFEPEQLKVFDKLPADEINTRVHESFAPQAPMPTIPASAAEWETQRDQWITALRDKCFRGWPPESEVSTNALKPHLLADYVRNDVHVSVFDIESQHDVWLQLFVLRPANVDLKKLTTVILRPLNSDDWSDFSAEVGTVSLTRGGSKFLPVNKGKRDSSLPRFLGEGHRAVAYIAPRGIGPTAWNAEAKERIHIRRRFMLLGQTLDGMRVWDVRRAIQSLRSIDGLTDIPLTLDAKGDVSGIALYAALFEPKVAGLNLHDLPTTHRAGPDFLNVLRILDVPQAVAMVAEKSQVRIYQEGEGGWEYPRTAAQELGWGDKVMVSDDNQSANSSSAASAP